MAKSQEDGTTILLGLKGYKVVTVTESEGKMIVEARAQERKPVCPYCSSVKLYRHGLGKRRRVLHSWSNGKKVYLELSRQRWRCQDCGHSFNDGAELLRPYSRMTKQAEQEALWQLKDRSFSQVKRDLGVSYTSLRRLLEKEIDGEVSSFLPREEEIFLGIDEHSFKHQELVYMVTEVKKRRVLRILKDDRIATLKGFLIRIPKDKVKEVCIDMKEGLRKLAEALFPEAKVVVDPFHVVADSNRRMDEARRIEQDVHLRRKVQIPKKIFLIGGEKLSEEGRSRLNVLLEKYPSIKDFYWAKEKVREVYRQESQAEAGKILDNLILNLRSADDGELIRWGNTLKHWRDPILNHFENGTSNGFTEGCNTKIKMLKRVSYGLRNAEVYWRKMLLGFVPCRSCFHNI
jgi:transposase